MLIKRYYWASRTPTDLYCGQIQGDTIYLSAALFWTVYLLKFQLKRCEWCRPFLSAEDVRQRLNPCEAPTFSLKITSLYCWNGLLHNKLVLAAWMKCLQGRGRAPPLYLEGNNLNLRLQSNSSRRASRVAAAVHSDSKVGLAICVSRVLFAGLVISRWMVPVCLHRLFVYLIIMWIALVFVFLPCLWRVSFCKVFPSGVIFAVCTL